MHSIAQQYERWPYPQVPLFARIHREQLWQINLEWLAANCGVQAATKPRIWITGCGTFQPYVFSRANPNAEILATDISQNSLRMAQKRCRWHGIRNVRFETINLNDESHYPNEKFDYIECYGVLMNLERPELVLKRLRERLNPQGILRLMVYPHYGRQRILQIQRLASLLGLTPEEPRHPGILKRVMRELSPSHPLRFAFEGYPDSKSYAGIVDGFLHVSRRAYTGIEIASLAHQAKLKASFYFHRPWGQPKEIARSLQLLKHDPALWLHYVDLWQNLQTNFTLCLTPSETSSTKPTWTKHPLFDLENASIGFRHRSRLMRLGVTGATLQSRTSDGKIPLSPSQIRNMMVGNFDDETSQLKPSPAPSMPLVQTTSVLIEPNLHFLPRLGDFAVNPLYAHLMDAYVFDRQWNHLLGSPLAPLDEQIRRWASVARPLENENIPWGLTPYGTYKNQPILAERLSDGFLSSPTGSFSQCHLDREEEKMKTLLPFLSRQRLPRNHWQPEELRELWVLLFSYRELHLRFEA